MEEKYSFIEKYWIFCIAFIIICINVGCRISDSVSSRDYKRTEGTVISIRSEKTTISTGGYYAGRYHVHEEGISRYATIEYKTDDRYYETRFSIKFDHRFFHTGDILQIMYKSENGNIVEYLAKRDWITGAWLDARKDYNTPLIISIVIIIAGIGYLYLINVLKPRFKNSWIVISIAGMLSGVIISFLCSKICREGSEMADEAFTGLIVGMNLVLFSFFFMIKMREISRRRS